MIQHNRKIRDAIKAAIQTDYSGNIFTTRSPDVRDERITDYVNVFFDTGERDDSEGLIPQQTAECIVGVHLALVQEKIPTDDDLDESAEKIIDAIAAHSILPAFLSGILLTGFDYSNDEEGRFSSLFIRYTLYF